MLFLQMEERVEKARLEVYRLLTGRSWHAGALTVLLVPWLPVVLSMILTGSDSAGSVSTFCRDSNRS